MKVLASRQSLHCVAMAFLSSLVVLGYLDICHATGVINFVSTAIRVEEKNFEQAQLFVQRTGGFDGDVGFKCEVENGASDFIDPVAAGLFRGASVTSSCSLYVTDDTLPEGNETFTVNLVIASGSASLGATTRATVTIIQNDDPYGRIGFAERLVEVDEPLPGSSKDVVLNVTREGGTIGDLVVYWKVFYSQNSMEDLEPLDGAVSLSSGETSKEIFIQIVDDDIPENEEIYTVRIVNITGMSHILENKREIELRIKPNDAPIAFKMPYFTADEPQVLQVTVLRGVDSTGRIGPINEIVNISYESYGGTAVAGHDYVPVNGTLVFQHSITRLDIVVRIIPDSFPELKEMFYIRLFNASLGVVLSYPNVTEIAISKNDDPHGVFSFEKVLMTEMRPVLLEDTVSIVINRSMGSHGNVSIHWNVTELQGGLCADFANHFMETSGTIYFLAGEKEKSLVLNASTNSAPRKACAFVVELVSVTGDGRLSITVEGNPKVQVISRDRNSAYGIVNVNVEKTSINLTSNPRYIRVVIQRSGGSLGRIRANISALYKLAGLLPDENSIFEETSPVLVFMDEGQSNATTDFTIRNDIFLKNSAMIQLTIDAVELLDAVIIPPKTPALGKASTFVVNITTAFANGEIAFSGNATVVAVEEPSSNSSYRLNLTIIRDGTIKATLVSWRVRFVTSTLTSEDIGAMDGFVIFQKGISQVNITLEIRPDVVPELDETFVVELYNVSAELERLRPGGNEAHVTILKNDNPGGTFEFQSSMPIFLQEKVGSFAVVNVTRTGGSLEDKRLLVEILPKQNDFSPQIIPLNFRAGVNTLPVPIYPNLDDIPELDEHFNATLLPLDDVIFGSNRRVSITIAQNDDPNGLVSFRDLPSNTAKTIAELPGKMSHALFELQRTRGAYGNVSVVWDVPESPTQVPMLDVRPTAGTVYFGDGQRTAFINITVLPDQTPEITEYFTIRLRLGTGGANVAEPSFVVLTIPENDALVSFKSSEVQVDEGNTASVEITLSRSLPYAIDVTYMTIDDSAKAPGDYAPHSNTSITFESGAMQKIVNIATYNDSISEGTEVFFVMLLSATGDTVFSDNPSANVTIIANDVSSGMFSFSDDSENIVAKEGEVISMKIERTGGLFGNVSIHWFERYNGSTGSDLIPSMGVVTFQELQTSQSLQITPRADGIPELNETITIVLYNATVETNRPGYMAQIDQSKRSTIEITVLENDDPRGLFVFALNSRDVTISEDSLPGYPNTTTALLSIERTMGLFDDVQVLWETFFASSVEGIPVRIWDAFFHGAPVSSPIVVEGRPGTMTKAFSFSGSNDCFSLSGNDQPSSDIIALGFTVSVWVLPSMDSDGAIFSKSSGLQNFLTVKLSLPPIVPFLNVSVISNNVMKTFTVYVPNDIPLTDGQWHSFCLTLSPTQGILYIDGKTPSTLDADSLSIPSQAPFYVGCSYPGQDHFKGSIQDVRIYPKVLTASEVRDISRGFVHIQPTNGYLTYADAAHTNNVTISSINNAIPEDRKVYSIRLIDVKGGARIATMGAAAKFEVEKSDYANGLFRFTSTSCNQLVSEGDKNITLSIDRQRGTFQKVDITWEVQTLDGTQATGDFLPAQGTITFDQAQTKEVISLHTIDDTSPELAEIFHVRLTGAISGDGLASALPISGTGIDPLHDSCGITIEKNDDPYGLFELRPFSPSPGTILVPLSLPLNISIEEDVGQFHLYIIRAQGLQGLVQCEWKTEAITAVENTDYQARVAVETFAHRQNAVQITINIPDNEIPELAKTFAVKLFNPTGGAILGNASVAYITILPSDDAYGIFSLEKVSRMYAEGETVTVTIQRQKGALGAVTLQWRMKESNSTDEVMPSSGVVTIAKEQFTGVITFSIVDDQLPELGHSFTIELFNPSQGRLNVTKSTAQITIAASDYPFGLFVMSPAEVIVDEMNLTTAVVAIHRERGHMGSVRISYRTARVSLVGQMEAIPNVDYVPVSDSIVFLPGESKKELQVTILNDDLPESMEYFFVNITNVELINAIAQGGADAIPATGLQDNTKVIINANDFANGVLQLSASVVNVTETSATGFLHVIRTSGLFGKVSVSFMIIKSGALTSNDYSVSSFQLTFDDGEYIKELPMTIVNDDVPEFAEEMIVRLLPESIIGGAVLGTVVECQIRIAENDYPYGVLGFSNVSRLSYVMEPLVSPPTIVKLNVTREYGREGPVQVVWNSTHVNNTGAMSTQISPSFGHVLFVSGEAWREISFGILPDDQPEINQTIQIVLERKIYGLAVINTSISISQVVILANDHPFGVVQFALPSYNVPEANQSKTASIELKRTGSFFGRLKVMYSTFDVSGLDAATASGDYDPVTDGIVIFGESQTTAYINIGIIADDVPELNEQFGIRLTSVELMGHNTARPGNEPKIGIQHSANITILANDAPYGEFVLKLQLSDRNSNGKKYTVTEPTSASPLAVAFTITRTKGTIGAVSVSWRIGQPSTAEIGPDIGGGNGATINFANGERTATFIVSINNDDLPEYDEDFTVELYNPTAGSLITQDGEKVQVIIRANDGVAGRVDFDANSKSVTAQEGDMIELFVGRTLPAGGNVTFNWTFVTPNASQDFDPVSGKLYFGQGVTSASIKFTARLDFTPETEKKFEVRVSDPIISGISSSGAADLLPPGGGISAVIILGASNDPHGTFEFVPPPLNHDHSVDEGANIRLTILRESGTIGDVLLTYQAFSASLPQIVASAGSDFNGNSSQVTIKDGEQSTVVDVMTYDDSVPEEDEVFYVNITSVLLLGISSPTIPPKIGDRSSVKVVIKANDGTQGELAFSPLSTNPTYPETAAFHNLTVQRYKGAFGRVYCFYFVNKLSADGDDFHLPGKIMSGGVARLEFQNGERSKNITFQIKNDNITEQGEQFEVGLTIQNAIDNGGVVIGSPSRAIVTIKANDDAFGVFGFAARSTHLVVSEPPGIPSAKLVVERTMGTYGTVIVQINFVNVSAGNELAPLSDTLIFTPSMREASLDVTAIADDTPELNQTYLAQLSIVSGGGRISAQNIAAITIVENDDPHGRLSISFLSATDKHVLVEETAGSIQTLITRHGGVNGQVSVKLETVSKSAVSSSGDMFALAIDQLFSTLNASSFHAFRAFGSQYLVLAMYATQESSSGAGKIISSTLFVWRGYFVPIQHFPGETTVEWSSATINRQTFLIQLNHGRVSQYEVNSSVYIMTNQSHAVLTQSIPTVGATDIMSFTSAGQTYLVIANQIDNAGDVRVKSQVYEWNNGAFSLLGSGFETSSATSLHTFTIDNSIYLAVTNSFDRITNSAATDSAIYEWSTATRRFRLFERIPTSSAMGVSHVAIEGINYLLFANNIGQSQVLRFMPNNVVKFGLFQTIPTNGSRSVEQFRWNGTEYIAFAGTPSMIYRWNSTQSLFEHVKNISGANDIYAFTVTDPSNSEISYLAIAASETSSIARPVMVSSDSDFVARNSTIVFADGQREALISVTILQDTMPEIDERFDIFLTNPSTNLKLEQDPSLTVTILSNNNAYGRVEFAAASLSMTASELEWDTVVSLDLVRQFGSFGQIIVAWNLTSGSSLDVYPTSGTVVFSEGSSQVSVAISVRADDMSELDEVFIVSLISVSLSGSSNQARGPTINPTRSTARFTVLANDHPFGVFQWQNPVEVTTEYTEINSSVVLVIQRHMGTFGAVVVKYETRSPLAIGTHERAAIPGTDYMSVNDQVTFKDGEMEKHILVGIRHDNSTTTNEIFLVNLTSVELIAITPPQHEKDKTPPTIASQKDIVQVVITETILDRGYVQFSESQAAVITVEENIGFVELMVERVNGTEGTVGVEYHLTSNTTTSSDFSPSKGVVTFQGNETSKVIRIQIIDDYFPELDEWFRVVLKEPIGGVSVGRNNTVTIVISKNDYPYGLIRFAPSSLRINNATEGSRVNLTVQRRFGLLGNVDVVWQCETKAGADLSPITGMIAFDMTNTEVELEIFVIDDSVPELDETYTCGLVSASNNAVIDSDNKISAITILSNDKPYGVVRIDSQSRDLLVAEPNPPSYSGAFEVIIRRDVGSLGSIRITWCIDAADGGTADQGSVFNATSGVVQFDGGLPSRAIHLQVKTDQDIEASRRYVFSIVIIEGQAELDSAANATQAIITVADSGNPYGVFLFDPPLTRMVTDEFGTVQLSVKRTGGCFGVVQLHIVAGGGTAIIDRDFTVSATDVTFREGQCNKVITVTIRNDTEPELTEWFVVNITSVQLQSDKPKNFTLVNGLRIDTPPLIDDDRMVNVTIDENDKPYGVIEFKSTSLVVHEWENRIDVEVVREGGSYGTLNVVYDYVAVSASIQTDFILSGTSLIFNDGVSSMSIPVQIVDDIESEVEEIFELHLRPSPRVQLGAKTVAVVTIAASDNPYGVFGFYNVTSLAVENPIVAFTTNFIVYRIGGRRGVARVKWRITRKESSASLLSEDIMPGSGEIVFNADGSSSKSIGITVLPYGGPQEIGEEFVLHIYEVDGGGSVDVTSSNVTITVKKKGHPNGMFGFTGVVSPSAIVDEPQGGQTVVILPVQRSLGIQGVVTVKFQVMGIDNTSLVRQDLFMLSEDVVFSDGQTTANIHINIVADDIPELDESFRVVLLSADNGGDIDDTANSLSFTVRENDSPYGVFFLPASGHRLEYNSTTMERFLEVTVERKTSFMGNVDVNLEIRTLDSIFTPVVIMSHTVQKIFNRISFPSNIFLRFNSSISVAIIKVTKRGAQVTHSPPILDDAANTTLIVVAENFANSLVYFEKMALHATQDGSVQNVDIVRDGTFADITVEWQFGYVTGSLPTGFVEGQLNPSRGSVSLSHGQRKASISFQVQLPTVLDRSLIYAIHLTENLSPPRPSVGWPMIGQIATALVEPHGVVEFSGNALYAVIEGNSAVINLKRGFSSLGKIRINVTTVTATGANRAQPGVDFVAMVTSVEMTSGQYEKSFSVATLNQDAFPELDEIFYVDITSVESIDSIYGLATPRLGQQTRAQITIHDDDNPFGVVGFASVSQNILVSETTRTVPLKLVRSGGTYSLATARVRTIGGGEQWDGEVIGSLPENSAVRMALQQRTQAATANVDYLPVDQNIMFAEQNTPPPNGQTESFSLTIFGDTSPEPKEQIVLVLTNITGGARSSNSAGDLQYFAIVTIDSNGLWNGQIRFDAQVATLDEDGPGAVNLTIQRLGSASQNITVQWEAISPSQTGLLDQLQERQGEVVISVGQTSGALTLRAKHDEDPELQASIFVNLTSVTEGASIDRAFAMADVILAASDFPDGVIGFEETSRYTVVQLGDRQVQLILYRYNGTLSEVTVTYQTVVLVGPQNDGAVVINAALGGQDFERKTGTVKFAVGQRRAFITVTLLRDATDGSVYPKSFNVQLTLVDKDARFLASFNVATVTISKEQKTSQFLSLRYSSLLMPLTDGDIERILSQLLLYASKPPLSANDLGLMKNTILAIVQYKTGLPATKKAFTSTSRGYLMDIFNVLLDTTRIDTRASSDWAKVVEETAYAFLNDKECPIRVSETRSRLTITLERNNASALNAKIFYGSNFQDFLRYPVGMFNPSAPNNCHDVHFVEYQTGQWFPNTGTPILGNKVLSSSIKPGLTTGMSVVYRIHSVQDRVTSTGAACVIWKHASSNVVTSGWDSSNCVVKGETSSYVECSCRHLSEYAIQAFSDNRTGYEVYFFVACFICMGACFLAITAHHLCSVEITFTTSLLMHLLFAVMMTNLLYAVSGYISPDLLTKQTECSVLAMFMHYFFLCQFTWMFIQGCNLWRILVMNDEHTYRKFVPFFLVGWGLPVIVVIAYIFITYAVYDWEFTTMYSDVHGNGDMCFMSNEYSALATVVAPVLLLLMGILVVFVQAYQVTPQWKCYDDIYRGRYNVEEIRYLIVLFTLITLVWIFAGLHMAFGKLWMAIVFTTVNVALGIFILVLYVVLRNQMRNMFRTSAYNVRSDPSRLDDAGGVAYGPRRYAQTGRKVNESQQQLDINDWEDVDAPIMTDRRGKLPAHTSPIQRRDRQDVILDNDYAADADSQDFDDLIYALKTGGSFTPSVNDTDREDSTEKERRRPPTAEHYEMRTIDITDTHL